MLEVVMDPVQKKQENYNVVKKSKKQNRPINILKAFWAL